MTIRRLGPSLLAGLLSLVVLALPSSAQEGSAADGFRRAWLRSLATQIKNDLRLIDASIDQCVIENNLPDKSPVRFDQLKVYLKEGTRLRDRAADVLGTPFAARYVAGELPRVPAASALALAEVADKAFWDPFETEPTAGVRPATLPPQPTPPPGGLLGGVVEGFDRARLRSQGTTMKNDLRLIDAAKDQYAIEFNKEKMTPAWSDLTPYFKPGSRLATSPTPVDLLGNPYLIGDLEASPKISPATARALADACDDAFWSPFK